MKKLKDFIAERCWPGHKPVPGKKPYSPGSCVKEELNLEDLRNWFNPKHPDGGWKRINSKGEAIGPCAREPGEAKPKCMSNKKRASLTKKERASAVASKRRHDPNPERKGKPINVSNFGKGKISEAMENLEEKNVPTSPEKWAQAKAQAKAKFDVYPSAYANGWAAKKYKEMGGGWKSESTIVNDAAKYIQEKSDCNKTEEGKDCPVHGMKSCESLQEDWQDVNRKDKTDGLSQKAVNAYRRENPGSKLQTAVTEKNPKGKRASRRKSFCARMGGMKKRLTKGENARDPDSPINKALRRWNC